MTDCQKEHLLRRTSEFLTPSLGSEGATDRRKADSLPCADHLQLRDGKEYGLDRTLSETFPCSDPLSSVPNPVANPFSTDSRSSTPGSG